ncbi:MAG: peptidylprolyl isomerase [Candidatus Cloacimonadaceae bacterium]
MSKTVRTALCIMIIMFLAVSLAAQKKTNPGGIVGKIGSKSYTFAEYNEILNNYFNYWQSREGRLSTDRKKELNDRCWEELIGRQVYDTEIRRRGLVITDQEAMDAVLKDPPVQVRQIEALMTDGKFDSAKFRQALDVDAQFKESVLNLVKETMVYDKLFRVIKAQVSAKPDSVKNVWLKNNNLVSAKIIYFDFNTIPELKVAEIETRDHYEVNQANFLREPARRYRYLTVNSDKYIQVTADSLYQELVKGADFSELAKQFSEDPGSGQQGGDLGWFGRGRMVKPFEDTAFALADSAISPPIKSQFGLHIIQTLGRRTNDNGEEEVNARHILIKSDPNDEIKQKLQVEAGELLKKVKTKGVLAVAKEHNLTVQETQEFYQKDRSIREFGSTQELIAEAFTYSLGHVPASITGRNGEIYIAELSDSLGAHYAYYEKEKPNIIQAVQREKKIRANKQRAKEFYENNAGQDYIAIAERDSMKIVDAADLKEGSSIPEIGNIKVLTDSLFATSESQYTGVVENETNAYIGYVYKRNKPDPKDWDKQKAKLLAAANDDVKTKHINNWYYNQRQKLTIEDNRKDYYELASANRGGMQQIQLNP